MKKNASTPSFANERAMISSPRKVDMEPPPEMPPRRPL
jgi:hypothetical protein